MLIKHFIKRGTKEFGQLIEVGLNWGFPQSDAQSARRRNVNERLQDEEDLTTRKSSLSACRTPRRHKAGHQAFGPDWYDSGQLIWFTDTKPRSKLEIGLH